MEKPQPTPPMPTEPPKPTPPVPIEPPKSTPAMLFTSGFCAGVVITGLFNPVDRALYLSASKQRPFLHPSNWKRPFQGLGQSIIGRAVSTGLWFPLEAVAIDAVGHHTELSPSVSSAVAGQLAGATNALLLSPLSFIKFQTWGLPEGKRSFSRTFSKIYRTAGAMAFFRGLPATVLRDAIFGGCFAWLRFRLRNYTEVGAPAASNDYPGGVCFAADAAAAGAATTVSAPLNYARNVQFGTPVSSALPTTWTVVGRLWREASEQPTASARVRVLMQRTNVGWGTLRVAAGMALTSSIFSGLVRLGDSLSQAALLEDGAREKPAMK